MLKQADLYGITPKMLQHDSLLIEYRRNLIHSAALQLHQANLVVYKPRQQTFIATSLGQISSYYYIHYQTMIIFQNQLHAYNSIFDLFDLITKAKEFMYIQVRSRDFRIKTISLKNTYRHEHE